MMAFTQGIREVRIVDGNRRDLARWSRDGNIEILSPKSPPAAAPGARKEPSDAPR